MSSKTKDDGPKLTLPAGHPQAGYLSPDLSFVDGIDEDSFDDDTKEAREEAQAAREEEVAAVEENEHKVASDELAKAEEKAKAAQERLKKVASGEMSQQQADEAASAQATLDATATEDSSSSK